MEIMSVQVLIKTNALQIAPILMDTFRVANFTVGALVANNFSITAPVPVFELLFGVANVKAARSGRESTLPLNALPLTAQNAIDAIVVPRQPDFGPRSF
jgi:hypothetical protein